MGWATMFTTTIDIDRVAFRTLDELDDEIEDTKNKIENYRRKIVMYAISSPTQTFAFENGDNIIDFISREIDEVLELYEKALIKLKYLHLLKAYLKGDQAKLDEIYPFKEY